MPRLNQRFGPRPSEVGARIRAERERIGLTQEAVATRLGILRNTYKNLESTANPQASTLIGLKAVGFDLRRVYPELFD